MNHVSASNTVITLSYSCQPCLQCVLRKCIFSVLYMKLWRTLTNGLRLLFLSKTVKCFVAPTSWLDSLSGYLKTSAQALLPSHRDQHVYWLPSCVIPQPSCQGNCWHICYHQQTFIDIISRLSDWNVISLNHAVLSPVRDEAQSSVPFRIKIITWNWNVSNKFLLSVIDYAQLALPYFHSKLPPQWHYDEGLCITTNPRHDGISRTDETSHCVLNAANLIHVQNHIGLERSSVCFRKALPCNHALLGAKLTPFN